MINKVKKIVKQEVDVITSITCDRCRKNLGKDMFNMKGGSFIPSFNYGSEYDSSEYDKIDIILCDQCIKYFYSVFIDDPTKKQ